MVKTATFESLLSDAVPDGKGGYHFTLEGKTYHLLDKDECGKLRKSMDTYLFTDGAAVEERFIPV